MKNLKAIIWIALILTFTSCVSTRKFNELEMVKEHYKHEAEILKQENEKQEKFEADIKKLQAENKSSLLSRDNLTVKNKRLEEENADLLTRYNQLLEHNKSLLNTSSYEKRSLEEQLAAKEVELDKKEKRLRVLEYTLNDKEGNMKGLEETLAERSKKVNELEALLNQKDAQMYALKSSIRSALVNLSASDLTVEEKNGKLYVSMSQDLLFKKGSSKVEFKGKNALKEVAMVLNANPEIKILVMGHTDSDGAPARNWDLSVERATSVVKVLSSFNVDPKRMVAAGKALYEPLAPNDSTANKAKNRRTEIILEPNLDDIFRVIGD